MTLTFIELSGFTRDVPDYFGDDEAYASFQRTLLNRPEGGTVMRGCGGIRKVRWHDARRGKGKRGGLRVIYLLVPEVSAVLLLDVYDKDEADDTTPHDRKIFTQLALQLRRELTERITNAEK